MSPVLINRWIDMDSAEFKRIENHAWIYRFTLRAIELGAVKVDMLGCIWGQGPDGKYPVHAELDGKLVGLRYSAKAIN